MRYVFKNDGKPYTFGDINCHGIDSPFITYLGEALFNLRSIELIKEKHTEKNINYFIKIGYQPHSSQPEINYTVITVLPEEIDMAKEVIAFLQPKIDAYNEIYSIKTVPVLDLDGKTYDIAVNMKLDDGNKCLVCGGKTYHTHVNCFKNWKADMRKGFKGWKVITIKDAEKQGLKKCNFCKKNDEITLDDILKEDYGRDYEEDYEEDYDNQDYEEWDSEESLKENYEEYYEEQHGIEDSEESDDYTLSDISDDKSKETTQILPPKIDEAKTIKQNSHKNTRYTVAPAKRTNKKRKIKLHNGYSAKTYKVCGWIALIVGILSALIGLLSFAVGGFIIVILGIPLILLGLLYIQQSKEMTQDDDEPQ